MSINDKHVNRSFDHTGGKILLSQSYIFTFKPLTLFLLTGRSSKCAIQRMRESRSGEKGGEN